MRPTLNENPEYFDFPLAEYRGNPLVEVLSPPPLTDDEAIMRLREVPRLDPQERELPALLRMEPPKRLLDSFMFPSTQHISIMKRLYIQIIGGYKHRNPLTSEGQRLLYTGSMNNHDQAFKKEAVTRPASISFLTGLSGMGKSTLIRAIMNSLGSQVIRHSSYRGSTFSETQLISLMRNVPDQASAKALCQSFGENADILLGTNLYQNYFSRSHYTRRDYVRSLRKIVANYHVGAFIIDEFQNISLAKSGGISELLALILNLRDELGVPIILIGTHKAAELLKNSVSVARRLVDGGYYELERPLSPHDDDWITLCEVAWGYQWVKDPIPLSEEILDTLYACTQGITGIMLNLFVFAQLEAIESGVERIDASIIKRVYQKQFKPLHAVIEGLRTNNDRILRQFDDIYLNFYKAPASNDVVGRLGNYLHTQELQQPLFADSEITDKTSRIKIKNTMTADEMLQQLSPKSPEPLESVSEIFGEKSRRK